MTDLTEDNCHIDYFDTYWCIQLKDVKTKEEAEALKKQILDALEFYDENKRMSENGAFMSNDFYTELKDKAEKWDSISGGSKSTHVCYKLDDLYKLEAQVKSLQAKWQEDFKLLKVQTSLMQKNKEIVSKIREWNNRVNGRMKSYDLDEILGDES